MYIFTYINYDLGKEGL